MNLDKPVIAKQLFGMDIRERPAMMIDGKLTPIAPLITLVIEDDEAWHRQNTQFDAGWLNDLIACATAARDHINKGR